VVIQEAVPRAAIMIEGLPTMAAAARPPPATTTAAAATATTAIATLQYHRLLHQRRLQLESLARQVLVLNRPVL
jgi:hypothetical protein